jgi:hypothetical protein
LLTTLLGQPWSVRDVLSDCTTGSRSGCCSISGPCVDEVDQRELGDIVRFVASRFQ